MTHWFSSFASPCEICSKYMFIFHVIVTIMEFNVPKPHHAVLWDPTVPQDPSLNATGLYDVWVAFPFQAS